MQNSVFVATMVLLVGISANIPTAAADDPVVPDTSQICAGKALVGKEYYYPDNGLAFTGWVAYDDCPYLGVFERVSDNSTGNDKYEFYGVVPPGCGDVITCETISIPV